LALSDADIDLKASLRLCDAKSTSATCGGACQSLGGVRSWQVGQNSLVQSLDFLKTFHLIQTINPAVSRYCDQRFVDLLPPESRGLQNRDYQMAPKKKKKAASNPARGFATVSLPSKAKVDDAVSESEPAPAYVGGVAQSGSESRGTADVSQSLLEPSSYQDMTADQLEVHLEDAELENIVEKSAGRVKGEAAWQVARLETERRTLRAQAMPLETDDWLTEGLVEEILTLYQSSEIKHEGARRLPQHDKEMQRDDLLVKLWTLQQVLRLLHIPHEERVLKHVVSLTSDCNLISKDYIWGLEEALDWLALHASAEELPSYQPSIQSSHRYQSKRSAPSSSCEGSRATSSTWKGGNGSRKPVIDSTKTTTPVNTHTNRADHSDVRPAPFTDTESSTDDDNDPEKLVSRYIDMKLQLLKLEPEFQYDESPTSGSNHEKGLKPSQISRLRQKIETVERDILFDHSKANVQLNEMLIQFRAGVPRPRAERQATKPLVQDNLKATSSQDIAERQETPLDPVEAGDAGDSLFGDMFTPAENFLAKNHQNAQNGEDGSMLLVDFGKWAGISPRRVLEDTCKTR
jgi:ATP-dependent RNA helicase DHX29